MASPSAGSSVRKPLAIHGCADQAASAFAPEPSSAYINIVDNNLRVIPKSSVKACTDLFREVTALDNVRTIGGGDGATKDHLERVLEATYDFFKDARCESDLRTIKQLCMENIGRFFNAKTTCAAVATGFATALLLHRHALLYQILERVRRHQYDRLSK